MLVFSLVPLTLANRGTLPRTGEIVILRAREPRIIYISELQDTYETRNGQRPYM
jgi:hypothetical protein